MARYSAVGLAQGGSATLPFGSVYAVATSRPIIREVKVFTLAANAARIRLVRLSTAGTPGTGLTERPLSGPDSPPALCTAFNAHSVAPTIDAGEFDIGEVGAVIGSGFVYTYYGEGHGLYIPPGTANGFGLIEVADTVNTYDWSIIWDE